MDAVPGWSKSLYPKCRLNNLFLLGLLLSSGPDPSLRALAVKVRIEPSRLDFYRLGLAALQQGEMQQARAAFEKIPERDYRLCYYLGLVHYRLGNLSRASVFFELALQYQHDFQPPLYYLALIALKNNNLVQARQYLRKLTAPGFPRDTIESLLNAYEHLQTAAQALAADDYAAARGHYEAVTGFFGYREIGLALAYRKLGQTEQSLSLLDTVINTSPVPELINRALITAGLIDLERKDYPRARSRLSRCLTDSSDQEIRFLVGLTYSHQNRYDSAASYFDGLPDSVDRYLFFQGRNEYFRGNWGSAEEKLLRHRELFPGSEFADRTIFILGSIEYKRRDYRPAILYWDELLREYPASDYRAIAAKNRADAYFALKDYRAALAAYQDLDAFHPSPMLQAESRLRWYECRFFLHYYPSLIAALRAFVEENSQSPLVPQTQLRIAKIFYDQKEYYSCLAELDNLLTRPVENTIRRDALIERARVANKIGLWSQVKATYQRLIKEIETTEDVSFALNELGHIYANEARFDSALLYYQPLLNYEKYREMTMLEIAKIYHQLGQPREAVVTADNFMREFPQSLFLVDVALIKTKALRRSGRHQLALELLNELTEKYDTRPELFLEIGDICQEIKEFKRARDAYLKACELFRQDRDAAAGALLRAGEAAQALGNKTQARDYYSRASLIAESHLLKNQASNKIARLED